MGLIFVRRPRDYQCSRLYRAEREVAAYLRDSLPTVADIQRYVDEILRNPWMQLRFGSSVRAPITVVGGRQRPAFAQTYYASISMPKWSRCKLIVIHEMCHILVDRYYGQDCTAGHGPEFATFELALVECFLGADDGCDLHDAFARHGVEHSYRGKGQLP